QRPVPLPSHRRAVLTSDTFWSLMNRWKVANDRALSLIGYRHRGDRSESVATGETHLGSNQFPRSLSGPLAVWLAAREGCSWRAPAPDRIERVAGTGRGTDVRRATRCGRVGGTAGDGGQRVVTCRESDGA